MIKPTDLTDAALLAWARATLAAIGSGELAVAPLERGPEDRAGFALRARLAVSAIDRLTTGAHPEPRRDRPHRLASRR